MTEVYDNFQQLFINKVDPLKKENPDWLRVDGAATGGNMKVFAYFLFENKKWRINMDTHFKQLEKAYQDLEQGNLPFVVKSTRGGKECLELREGLASRPKHLFIYAVGI